MPYIYVIAENQNLIRKELFREIKDAQICYGEKVPFVELFAADVIVYYVTNEQIAVTDILELREEKELFLKPIYLVAERELIEVSGLIDETIFISSTPQLMAQKLRAGLELAKKVNLYQKMFPLDNPNEILLLRYLETRPNYHLNPMMDYQSRVGYTFPLVSALLNAPDADEIAFLDSLSAMFLLSRNLLDKVHLCPFCKYAQINFREICPKCKSITISASTDSGQFKCNECLHQFTLVNYDCLCFYCGKRFTPETALVVEINGYTITQAGIESAKQGVLPTSELMKTIQKETGYYTLDEFREMLKQEVRRCTRYNYPSTLIRFKVKNPQFLVERFGLAQAQKIWKEIATIFMQTFRDTDILTEYRVNEHLAILPHTDIFGAQKIFDRIKEQVSKKIQQTLDIQYQALGLQNESFELELLLEKMGG
ncbi:MAG: diguanylate cyclase [bacterium]|nr:diguanylate cyclase [bacterium]